MDDINEPEDVEVIPTLKAEVSNESEKWSGWKGDKQTDLEEIKKYNTENYPEDTHGPEFTPPNVLSDKHKVLDRENLTFEEYKNYKDQMKPELYRNVLYVGELDFNATEKDIIMLPGIAGKAIGIKLPTYHLAEHVVNWAGHPGFCYIHFDNPKDVKTAFDILNSYSRPVKLLGREVFADYCGPDAYMRDKRRPFTTQKSEPKSLPRSYATDPPREDRNRRYEDRSYDRGRNRTRYYDKPRDNRPRSYDDRRYDRGYDDRRSRYDASGSRR